MHVSPEHCRIRELHSPGMPLDDGGFRSSIISSSGLGGLRLGLLLRSSLLLWSSLSSGTEPTGELGGLVSASRSSSSEDEDEEDEEDEEVLGTLTSSSTSTTATSSSSSSSSSELNSYSEDSLSAEESELALEESELSPSARKKRKRNDEL